MAFSGSGLHLGGPTYPFVVVSCSVCGFSVLVNAIKAGIVQRPTEDDAQSGDSAPPVEGESGDPVETPGDQ
jgi:hypothetical protein